MGQALKGFSCGGRTYGYRHVPIMDGTQLDEYGRPRILAVKREIDEGQAHWVRQSFTWYAAGKSPRWIAGELNRSGVPAPGAAYKRKSCGKLHGTWSASALHGVRSHGTGLLHNPLYIGRLI
jgi:site-specific DNA recombinase